MRKQINVSLSEDEYAFYEKLAKENNLKISSLIHFLLKVDMQGGKVPELAQKAYLTAQARVNAEEDAYKVIWVRLRTDELAALDRFCDGMDMRRTEAVISLIRNLTANEPIFNIEELHAIRISNIQLRRIGVNINQIAHIYNIKGKDSGEKADRFLKETAKRVVTITQSLDQKIKKHVAIVWKLLNAARNRTHLNAK